MLCSMRINLIYARAANGVIGKDNAMPWHLPEDLAHFRRWTQGCPVIMGRATWDSLPPKFRPLPGRLNLVLTRDATRAQTIATAGAVAMASLQAALDHCARLQPPPADVWVMGGAQIYAQALPLAQRAVVTEIDHAFDGDAHAPALDANWRETTRDSHTSGQGWPFHFVTYVREAPPCPAS